MDSDGICRFKYSITHWCVTRCEGVNRPNTLIDKKSATYYINIYMYSNEKHFFNISSNVESICLKNILCFCRLFSENDLIITKLTN